MHINPSTKKAVTSPPVVVGDVVAVVVGVVLPHSPAPSGHTFSVVNGTHTFAEVLHGPTVPEAQSSHSTASELQSRYVDGHVRFSGWR